MTNRSGVKKKKKYYNKRKNKRNEKEIYQTIHL